MVPYEAEDGGAPRPQGREQTAGSPAAEAGRSPFAAAQAPSLRPAPKPSADTGFHGELLRAHFRADVEHDSTIEILI